MKSTFGLSSLINSQGNLEADRRLIALLSHIKARQSVNFTPEEKMLALKEVINIIRDHVDIRHLGVKTVQEEIDKLFGSPQPQLMMQWDLSLGMRIIPIYGPRNLIENDLTANDMSADGKVQARRYWILYLNEDGDVIYFEVISKPDEFPRRLRIMKSTNEDILRFMGKNPLVFYHCLNELMDLIHQAIQRAEKRVMSLTAASTTLGLILRTACDNDLDAMILLTCEGIYNRSPSVSAFHAMLVEVVKIAGNTPTERIERLTEAARRLRMKDLDGLCSRLPHIGYDGFIKMINEV